MRLWSDSFADGMAIPAECAFAVMDRVKHVRFASNRNPHLAWDEVPNGTQSLVLLCRDVDAPTVGTDVNQEGRLVAESLPRADFYHWALIDIPLALSSISTGMFSELVTPHGKQDAQQVNITRQGQPYTLRQGVNDYSGWFQADPAMAGDYYGYDGPCPPWNDLRVHTYLFTLYALDIPRLALEGRFTGLDVKHAIHGHLLDEAQIFGVYTLNPDLADTLD
ncbi:MAG: YbhB/YbcL family Raf kinase inhibitor-like protein [Massilia sp.]